MRRRPDALEHKKRRLLGDVASSESRSPRLSLMHEKGARRTLIDLLSKHGRHGRFPPYPMVPVP